MKGSSPPFLSFLCTNASPTFSFFVAKLLFSHIHASQEITCQSIEGPESVHSFNWKLSTHSAEWAESVHSLSGNPPLDTVTCV